MKWWLLAMMGMLELFVGEHVETTTCLISSISTGLPLDLLHSRGITLSWNLQTTLLWVSIIFMFSTWAFFSWSCSWASYRPWEVWGLSVEHKINGISEDYFFARFSHTLFLEMQLTDPKMLSSITSLMMRGLRSWEIRSLHFFRVLLKHSKFLGLD